MTNALPVWKLNFAKFCAEGVKPEGNDYYADHFWLKNQRKNTERGLWNKAAFEKEHSTKTDWQDNLALLKVFFAEEVGSRMNIYHFKEH